MVLPLYDPRDFFKKIYFSSKQTCICEAAYRLIPGLDLKGSSLCCLFVASGFLHKRKKYVHAIDNEDDKEYDPIEDIEIDEKVEQYLSPENGTSKSKKVKHTNSKK